MTNYETKITIGMPIYNAVERKGESRFRLVIESWLNQSFSNFVLFISDNNSTDKTQEICEEYALIDNRIKYNHQSNNIGGEKNLQFVLIHSPESEYFTYAADDDIRSKDWLEINYNFLSKNPEFVASTSPNTFQNQEESTLIDFNLDGDEFYRYQKFFKNCYQSHALFSSLIRRNIIIELSSSHFSEKLPWLGFDWFTILSIASKGKIHRTKDGYMNVGVYGSSNKPTDLYMHNTKMIEYIMPFFIFIKKFINMKKNITKIQLIYIVPLLIKINIQAHICLLIWWLHLGKKFFLKLIRKS